MDDLAALRLQLEWGADDALLDSPVDRLAAGPAPRRLGRAPLALPAVAPAIASAIAAATPLAAGPATAAALANTARNLAELHAALDAFDTCGLRGTASTTVAPSGNPDAGLVLVAEAPGPDDDRSGQTLSGAAGARFDRIVASAGLSRNALLLAPMVPWRPPGGRPVNELELALCLPFLHRLLALTRPRHIVLLGAGPLRALTGDFGGIRRARGRWRVAAIPGLAADVAALPMISPDLWLSGAGNKQATWTDSFAFKRGTCHVVRQC